MGKKKHRQMPASPALAAAQTFVSHKKPESIVFKLPVQGGWTIVKLDGFLEEGILLPGVLLHLERVERKQVETAKMAFNLLHNTPLTPLPKGAASPHLAQRVVKEVMKRGYKIGASGVSR